MQITFDTTNLSDLDYQVMRTICGEPKDAAPAAPAAKQPAPAKKAAAAPTPEPTPEPEPAAESNMDAAVALATDLVAAGKAAEVKAVLTDLGVSRVSQLAPGDIPTFISELS